MLKDGIVLQSHGDFLDITKESSNHSETETSITEESILESNGSVQDHQEEEGIGERDEEEMSSVKKRCLSSHNSTIEVETDVVDVSKRVIVSGLPAKSKCPWRQPKNLGSRQVNDLNRVKIVFSSCGFMCLVLVYVIVNVVKTF